MNSVGKRILASLVVVVFLWGCESANPAKPPAAPAPVGFSVPPSRAVDFSLLQTHTQQLDSEVEQLPGSSAEEHRVILLSLLDELPRVLQLANGPVESPAFQNSLSVIRSAAVTIKEPGIDRRRMEAVENQALQAAGPALAEIVSRELYDDDQLPALLKVFDDNVNIAAASVGPIHDLDATNAFAAMEAVVDRISSGLAAKS